MHGSWKGIEIVWILPQRFLCLFGVVVVVGALISGPCVQVYSFGVKNMLLVRPARFLSLLRTSTLQVNGLSTSSCGFRNARYLRLQRKGLRYDVSSIRFASTEPNTNDIYNKFNINNNSLSSTASSLSPLAPSPIVVNLHLDEFIVKYLQMRQKKTRMVVSGKKIESMELQGLRDLIERRLPVLKGHVYRLAWKFPDQEKVEVVENSSQWVSALQAAQTANKSIVLLVRRTPGQFPPPSWPLDSSKNTNLSKSNSENHLDNDRNNLTVETPTTTGVPSSHIPNEAHILSELANIDPDDAPAFALISFYRFVNIDNLTEAATSLHQLWHPFHALGRIYVAHEGINAQMAIPENVLPLFCEATKQHPLLNDVPINVDERVLREEYEEVKPFRALHIRTRAQIVADGLSEPLDWSRAGTELSGLQWHEALNQVEKSNGIVLDCRNIYETDVGIFDHAKPLNTTFFRESWAALEENLKNVDKHTPILTYCTGGIRCVKINAFLEQKMGFQNTFRLKGGVIAYHRELKRVQAELKRHPSHSDETQRLQEDAEDRAFFAKNVARFYPPATEVQVKVEHQEVAVRDPALYNASALLSGNNTGNNKDKGTDNPVVVLSATEAVSSKFKGVNYVFDERMAARVSDHVLSQCDTCGTPCDTYHNCRNDACNLRFLQCPVCRVATQDCCSLHCRDQHATQEAARVARHQQETERQQLRMLTRRQKQIDQEKAARHMQQHARHTHTTPLREAPETHRDTSVEKRSDNNNKKRNGGGFKDHALVASQQPETQRDTPLCLSELLQQYSEKVSLPEPSVLRTVRHATQAAYPANAARMLSSVSQGSLLSLLATLTQSRRVLELGSFTGYSTLWLLKDFVQEAETADDTEGRRRLRCAAGREVFSCESDETAATLAATHFQLALGDQWRDKIHYRRETAQELLNRAKTEKLQFDMVFVDADKRNYLHYLRFLLGESDSHGTHATHTPLLSPGALIVIDNTLWKGLVLHYDTDLLRDTLEENHAKFDVEDEAIAVKLDDKEQCTTDKEDMSSDNCDLVKTKSTQIWDVLPKAGDFGAPHRMLRLAQEMHALNRFVSEHPSLHTLLLPLRDGLTLIRYQPPN